METYTDDRSRYLEWADRSLEDLVQGAMASANGVACSRFEMFGRTAALVVTVHPKVEPWKSRASHYFDENQGNPFSAIKGASYSLILDHAFECAKQGQSGVFVIYDLPVVVIASFVRDQIEALERDYLS